MQVQFRQAGDVARDGEEARDVVVEGEVVLVGHRDRERPLLADGGEGEVDHRHLGRDCVVVFFVVEKVFFFFFFVAVLTGKRESGGA